MPTTNNLSTTQTKQNLNNDNINTKPELKILSAKPVLNVLLEVLNIHGGNKKPADFMISVNGQGVNPITFAGSNAFKKVEIDAGNYDVKINDKYGYEINRVSGCTGIIERTDKTCIIELIDTPEILNSTEENSSINKIE
jgi:hypothetical protein